MTSKPRSLLDHRLIIVTGKGGVGKTTAACLLAEAARRAGQRVLLAETAPIEAVAARFDERCPRNGGAEDVELAARARDRREIGAARPRAGAA